MTREKFLHEMQEEFDFTIESIKKYGGFYIGRYETGNLSAKTPVVQRMNTDIGSQTWYTEYSRLQRLGANGNVKSNMIWGCLLDETLQWLVDSGNKTYEEMKDSTSWGNYYNSTFKYKMDTNGYTVTKYSSKSRKIPSGSAEYSKANNIYDMAGNVLEETLEGYRSEYRRSYGGDSNNEGSRYPASYRGACDPSRSDSGIGFRAYFYIK